MTDNQQLLHQYNNSWIPYLVLVLAALFFYLLYTDIMKKTNEEIVSQAKDFLLRLSVEGTLDYKNRSHVIEVNNFMIRHGKTLESLSYSTTPNYYAVLLGFLSNGESYLGMKVYTHEI